MRTRMRSARRDVYLMRGLPGMGKSTVASALAASTKYGERAAYCSADDYFLDEHGEYKFNKEELGNAHQTCQNKFMSALQSQYEVIVVDNTNIKRRDFQFYRKAAEQHGYRFFEITVGNLDIETSYTRNSHEVPLETIAKMAESFER